MSFDMKQALAITFLAMLILGFVVHEIATRKRRKRSPQIYRGPNS
jgi:hypothetical protein